MNRNYYKREARALIRFHSNLLRYVGDEWVVHVIVHRCKAYHVPKKVALRAAKRYLRLCR